MGERTAEEFVHELPDGRWFVADFMGRDPEFGGGPMYMAMDGSTQNLHYFEVGEAKRYKTKASAKRAAQKWLEAQLDAAIGEIEWVKKRHLLISVDRRFVITPTNGKVRHFDVVDLDTYNEARLGTIEEAKDWASEFHVRRHAVTK
jgi:hypothetical protein